MGEKAAVLPVLISKDGSAALRACRVKICAGSTEGMKDAENSRGGLRPDTQQGAVQTEEREDRFM